MKGGIEKNERRKGYDAKNGAKTLRKETENGQ